jgi:ABC-2 type transport system permease protein
MSKIWTVIKREYLQIVKTKGFIISTVLGPVLMASFIVIPVLLSLATGAEKKHYAVIDAAGGMFVDLDAKLADYTMGDKSRRYTLEAAPAGADPGKQRADLSRRILAKELSGFVFIPADVLTGGAVEFAALNVSDFDEVRRVGEALNAVVVEKRLKREGLDPARVAGYTKRVGLKTIKVTERGEQEDAGGTFLVAYILVIILYMTLFFYGAIIMRGVIEEKNNRVVEIVLSSMRPFELMMGKILGIAAVGLTQYAIWGGFGFLLSTYGRTMAGGLLPAGASGFKVPQVPGYVFFYFVLFFLLGYFLYATFYAAVGSMVNSEKEAQQLLMPVSMLLVIPMLMMMAIIKSPGSGLSVALSLVPFFAPILMLLRVCVLLPPAGQIAASIALLGLAILGMTWLAAKIYRVGVLMYGKRPSLPEVLKWVRYR